MFIAILMSSQILMSQALVWAGEPDGLLKIALEIEAQGKRLQNIQDSLGIKAAHHELEKMAKENLSVLRARTVMLIENISEEEAKIQVERLKNLAQREESTLMLLSDRSLTHKEKLYSIVLGNSSQGFNREMEFLKAWAEKQGYEKMFKELAQDFRSRYHWEEKVVAYANLQEHPEIYDYFFMHFLSS